MSSSRCKSCDRELPADHAAGAPCPGCGAEVGEAPPLEVDPAWAADKAAAQAAAAPPPPARSRAGRFILLGTSVVMIVVAIIMALQRRPAARGGGDLDDLVEITIRTPRPGVEVRVDGVKAGRTPLTLKLKNPRTRPMQIEGGGVAVDITPDRDQIVNLQKRK